MRAEWVLPTPPQTRAVRKRGGFLLHVIPTNQAVLGICIVLLNLVDAFCTLRNVGYGAQELNPLMAELLGGSGHRFVIVKHLLVSLGVCGILARSETRLARFALWGLLALFSCIAVYQVILWSMVR
jgi:hypothetical protein